MSVIMDGKKLAAIRLAAVKNDILTLQNKCHITVKLAIILVGDSAASQIYVRNKIIKAKEVGISTQLITLAQDIAEDKIFNIIDKLNSDASVHGIIIQLPLPRHIHALRLINHINPQKDVDGFHPLNVGYLNIGQSKCLIPCTALGCIDLLNYYIGDLVGKSVVVIGKSNIVGKPLVALLLQHRCTVTICHSATINLAHYTRNADIIISAVGKAHFLDAEHFNNNLAFIDVGINYITDSYNKRIIVGDGHFDLIKDLVEFITPVPGGVGPMTVAYLLQNTLTAAQLICENHRVI